MTITQVYQAYKLPPNLQNHMLTVAAVSQCIQDAWHGPQLDWQLTLFACLLHDMGNIIKFKRPFLGALEHDASYWEEVQGQYIAAYGDDVHQATAIIIGELGMGEIEHQVLAVISGMKQLFAGDQNILWETRILEYADCVVTPNGIEGFEARMADLQRRYAKKDVVWQQPFRENALMVEKYVDQDLTTLLQQDISDLLIAARETWLPTKISVSPSFFKAKRVD